MVKSNIRSSPTPDQREFDRNKKRWLWIILLVILGMAFSVLYIQMGEKKIPPGVELDEDGNIKLSPDRQAKLDRELEEIDNAVQYALIATKRSLYPCYSCPFGQKTIFLNPGEVWKYGVTRKGPEGRYPNESFGAPNLFYFRQYMGTYSECLKREKIMIYNYPLLPEAQTRNILLIRPPGNKYDR